MDTWERRIRNYDRAIRRRMVKINYYEITGLPVDKFINDNNELYFTLAQDTEQDRIVVEG